MRWRPVTAIGGGGPASKKRLSLSIRAYLPSRTGSCGRAPACPVMRSAVRPRPELVRQFGHLVAGPFQVRGPRQHALEDRLTAVSELPDHRDVALDTPDDRVADRGPVAGVSVRVQEQMEPPVPVGGVTESGCLG